MTIPPLPSDPMGGLPGGDPLGPIPGSEPPPPPPPVTPPVAPEPPAEEMTPAPVPQPPRAEPAPPQPAPWETPPASSPPPPTGPPPPPGGGVPPGAPVPIPSGKPRKNGKQRSKLMTLGIVLLAVLCFNVPRIIGNLTDSDDSGSSSSDFGQDSEEVLVADDYYSPEFELPEKVAGSPMVDRVDTWDHENCDGIAEVGVQDCRYAIEANYQREDIGTTMSQYILVFDDEKAAATGAKEFDEEKLPEQVNYTDPSDNPQTGAADSVERYVVLTVVEIDSEDNLNDGAKLFSSFHIENANVLHFT